MAELLNTMPKLSHSNKEPSMKGMFKGWTHLEFFKDKQCFEFLMDSKGEIRYTSYLARHFLHKTKQQLLDYIGDKYQIKETKV